MTRNCTDQYVQGRTSSSGGDGRGLPVRLKGRRSHLQLAGEGGTRDDLKTKVADHVRDVHKVEPVTDTVMSELEKAIKET